MTMLSLDRMQQTLAETPTLPMGGRVTGVGGLLVEAKASAAKRVARNKRSVQQLGLSADFLERAPAAVVSAVDAVLSMLPATNAEKDGKAVYTYRNRGDFFGELALGGPPDQKRAVRALQTRSLRKSSYCP